MTMTIIDVPVLGEVVVFGFEFPTALASKVAYRRASGCVDDLKRAGALGNNSGASVFRTRDPATERRHFVLVVDAGCGLLERVPWEQLHGTPHEPSEGETLALVERHLALVLEGRGYADRHYGLGADLHRGGRVSPRIGRDS